MLQIAFALSPPGKVHELKFIQPVPRFGILEQLGVHQMHIVADYDNMLIIVQIKQKLVLRRGFFHRDLLLA